MLTSEVILSLETKFVDNFFDIGELSTSWRVIRRLGGGSLTSRTEQTRYLNSAFERSGHSCVTQSSDSGYTSNARAERGTSFVRLGLSCVADPGDFSYTTDAQAWKALGGGVR